MICIRKPFYYVRHGETKRSLDIYSFDPNHRLTERGQQQARDIRPFLEKLPLDYLVTSTLDRAIETARLAVPSLFDKRMELKGLCECTRSVWLQLEELEHSPEKLAVFTDVQAYVDRVMNCLNQGLEKKGIPLFVAHGGTHWVISHILGLEKYDKRIDYCIPVFFSPIEAGGWIAERKERVQR